MIAIMLALVALAVPAFTTLTSSGNVTAASYEVSGLIEAARTYAMAHDTYTWVGFFEEDGSQPSGNPAQPGVGRIVLSSVASTDGTMIYNSTATAPVTIDPTRLIQINKLVRIGGAHLQTFSNGSGTGTTFDTRPPIPATNARIGGTTPPGALPFFQYPVGKSGTAQYVFSQVLQFSPRGEVLVSSMADLLTPLIEVGLQPVHGDVVNVNSLNLVALQISGISGNVILYRR